MVGDGHPASEPVQGAEVHEDAAVGAVDGEVAGGRVVFVAPSEEVDEGAEYVGEPVPGARHVAG